MEPAAVKFMGAFVPEFYYFMMSVLMFFIHIGFMVYEGGAVRSKNVLATMQKNYLTLSSIGIGFFLFGWWVYNGWPLFPLEGPMMGPWTDEAGLSELEKGVFGLTKASYPWSPNMGPHLGDNLTGVFWFAFALFAMTTASILSGAIVERAKMGAYLILSVILGSFLWLVAAAWGWHYAGWLLIKFGFHDFGCAAVVHGCAGFFTLGVLVNLGPRIGKFKNGIPQPILPHNLPMTLLGLMLIYGGFYGFLGACLIYCPGYTVETTIFGTPMTLASLGVNTTIAMVSGFMGAYISSRSEPFFTLSGGLAGIIGCSAGLDLYHPMLTMPIAFGFGFVMPKVALFIEKKGIDDVVGAFSVHGFCGVLSPIVCGIVASGFPNPNGYPSVNIGGQLLGSLIICVGLGLIPGYVISLVLKKLDLLRVSDGIETKGLDISEIGSEGYPERASYVNR